VGKEKRERGVKMARAYWSGQISCGVMGIRCKMYTAVFPEAGSRFNQIHRDCGSRIREPKWCPVCEKFVDKKDEIKKGYKVGKEEYVIFEEEELKALKLKSNGSIEITEFVEPSAISDVRIFGKPYFLAPDWDTDRKKFMGLKEFTLFSETLRITGLWAIGKMVQRDREHIVIIRPFNSNNILLLQEIRYQTELKDVSEIKTDRVQISERDLELSKMLFEAMKGDGDLSKFTDRYEEALQELVERKLAGETIKVEALPSREEAVDLAEQLLQSLEFVKKRKGE